MLENLPSLFRLSKQLNCTSLKISKVFNVTLLNRTNIGPSLLIPARTTMVVKRRYPPGLYKEGNMPRLKRRTFFYELVEDTDYRQDPLIDVVLKTKVPGVGNDGDIINLKRTAAYYKLILPGLADYATPETLEYSSQLKKDISVQEKQISPSVDFCMKYLQSRCMSIVMNKETEWTIEPWHVRASFRKAGVQILSESSIELPAKPISGPNLDLEGKEFYVTVTINKKHKVKVRCCIHHWSTAMTDRLPYVQDFWLTPLEKIFPEDNVKEIKPSTTQ
uniref:Large ribosomal subunit protein bL9m n=1 Tax=Cuerna arida TaxID=1464854 RepID=A0A1B6FEQ5_9HEMI